MAWASEPRAFCGSSESGAVPPPPTRISAGGLLPADPASPLCRVQPASAPITHASAAIRIAGDTVLTRYSLPPRAARVDLTAQLFGGRPRRAGEVLTLRRVQDGARGADDESGAIGGLAAAHRLRHIRALGADAGHEQRHVAHERAHLCEFFRVGRADDQQTIAARVPAL